MPGIPPFEETIQILTIGFGSMGSFYSSLLSRAGNVEVTTIIRSEKNYQEMKNGVEIKSNHFGDKKFCPHRIVRTSRAANSRQYDYILLCVKSVPELSTNVSLLKEFLDGRFVDPVIVLIQNGLGIEIELQRAYPQLIIISTISWCGVNHLGSNKFEHSTGKKLVCGLFTGEGIGEEADDPAGYFIDGSSNGQLRFEIAQESVQHFAALLSAAGPGSIEISKNIQASRFHKLLINVTLNAFCTITRLPVGDSLKLSTSLPLFRETMLEVISIARAWGYTEEYLSCLAVEEVSHTISTGFTSKAAAAFKPSMLVDFEHNRPLELEVILGSLISRAERKQVKVPCLNSSYAFLQAYQNSVIRSIQSR